MYEAKNEPEVGGLETPDSDEELLTRTPSKTMSRVPQNGANGSLGHLRDVRGENINHMTIHKQLFDLQQKIEAIKKDNTNPHFKSKYFDINGIIAALKPHLKEVGLVIIQPVQIEAGRNVLKTIIADASGNSSIESTIALPECAKPQDFGSAITYFRRYALQSLLLLEAEDDDGNLASQPTTPKKFQPIAQKETELIAEPF